MKDEDKRRLRVNRVDLVKDLDVKYVLDHLIATFVLDIDDDERIRAEKTRQDRAGKLLNMLEKSTNPNAYAEFRKALADPYPHLVEQLDKTPMANVRVAEHEKFAYGVQESEEHGRAEMAAYHHERDEYTDMAVPSQACASGDKSNVVMSSHSQKTTTSNYAEIKGRGNFVIMGGQNTTINIKSKKK